MPLKANYNSCEHKTLGLETERNSGCCPIKWYPTHLSLLKPHLEAVIGFSFSYFYIFKFYFMCMGVLSVCTSLHCLCAWGWRKP